ncbi:MAG: hypothetical protein AB7F35_00780 [Acetobacteraceae bacterium]
MQRYGETWTAERVQALAADLAEGRPRADILAAYGFRNSKRLSHVVRSLRRQGYDLPPLRRSTTVKDLAWEKRSEIQALWGRKEAVTLAEIKALGFTSRTQLLQGIDTLRKRGFYVPHRNSLRRGVAHHHFGLPRDPGLPPLPVSRSDTVAREALIALRRKGRAAESVVYPGAGTVYLVDGRPCPLPALIEQAGLLRNGRIAA